MLGVGDVGREQRAESAPIKSLLPQHHTRDEYHFVGLEIALGDLQAIPLQIEVENVAHRHGQERRDMKALVGFKAPRPDAVATVERINMALVPGRVGNLKQDRIE